MVRILDRNVKVWHLLVLGLLVGVLLGSTLTVAAVPAATSAGSVRLASARGTDADPVHVYGNATKRVLRATIQVPAGRTGDIQASFTGTIWPNTTDGTTGNTHCFGNFTLDSTTGSDTRFPGGNSELIQGALETLPSGVSVAMTGSSTGLRAGRHYVNVYVSSAAPGCSVADRQLNVVMILH